MRLHLWGTDFRRSTADTRSRLFVSPENRAAMLKGLLGHGFSDVVYLATCNRIEFYTTASDYFRDTRKLWTSALKTLGLNEEEYYQGYHLEGKAALRHLLRVASSLESLVVGEPQILGQLKDCLAFSHSQGIPVHPSLDRAFELAFATAKKVRSTTRLGEKPVSVATLGLIHLETLEKQYPLTKVALVGRSPIMTLVAQWLGKNRPSVPILWVNRSAEKLQDIPEALSAEKMPLSDFCSRPPAFSHLFTATSSRDPIFGGDFFRQCADRPLVFDFAEPPDVARSEVPAELAEILQLEDLKEEAQRNAEFRAQAVGEAEVIIETALKDYCLDQKEAPLLRDFGQIEPHFVKELESAWSLLAEDLAPETHERIRRWAEKLSKRHLHLSREHLKGVLRQITDPDVRAQEL